jgi:predicted metal-dependent RNase
MQGKKQKWNENYCSDVKRMIGEEFAILRSAKLDTKTVDNLRQDFQKERSQTSEVLQDIGTMFQKNGDLVLSTASLGCGCNQYTTSSEED